MRLIAWLGYLLMAILAIFIGNVLYFTYLKDKRVMPRQQ